MTMSRIRRAVLALAVAIGAVTATAEPVKAAGAGHWAEALFRIPTNGQIIQISVVPDPVLVYRMDLYSSLEGETCRGSAQASARFDPLLRFASASNSAPLE